MALSVHKALRKDKRQVRQIGRRATRFDRFPWLNITRSETKNARITMWIGVKTLVIGIQYPDGHPRDSGISVMENRLHVRSTVRNHVLRQSIVLPCPVETHPILIIEDSKKTTYIVLQKK